MRNWERCITRALKHKMYRAIHLARTNPDYQIEHPSELRNNPEGKVLLHCHKEAEKRIIEQHQKMIKLAIIPKVDRPKRFNRIG